MTRNKENTHKKDEKDRGGKKLPIKKILINKIGKHYTDEHTNKRRKQVETDYAYEKKYKKTRNIIATSGPQNK